jgi:hypothetical protein
VAAEQQMVWRVHTKLYRRKGANEENQDCRFKLVMDNDNFFNSFYARPPLASAAGSANADNHDSSGNRSKHAYLKAANFQKEVIFT